MRKPIVVVFFIVVAISFIFNGNVYAGNGTRFLGFSARDDGMAGATTASPGDTSVLVKNPAGLVRIGNRIDAEYMNIMPHDVTMETQGVAVPPTPVSLSRVGAKQDSTVTYLPGGNVGVSYRIPGTNEHPVSVGIGIFTMGGLAVDYPSSRLNNSPFILGNNVYDKQVDLRSMRIAPGLAVGLTDKLSFGATTNIAIQGIRTDLAKSNLQETAGSGKWDFAPGAGFTLGLLYQFSEMLGLGVSYESHTWMGYHHKYKDVLHLIDEPPVLNMGVSLKPIKNLEVTYDTRYINWSDSKITRNRPSQGGFGWQDQWVFAVGGEYTFKDKKDNDKLKLRMGYDYGESPIRRWVVFANALSPLILEHHLTMGFSYFLTKDFSMDFAWQHGFKNTMSDNGLGDINSQNGIGTRITAAADVIEAGIGYKF